ncbi:MAG: type II secretion system major pseudopilin GspG [Bdellovibrionales bacterium]|nr:type II secretion system major pseudopilin GspG [Bdellovibrionales bacterium]
MIHMRRKNRKKTNSGFSIIELVAAMIIMGLLAGVATVSVVGYVNRAKKQAAETNINTLETAIKTFQLECGFYPSTLEELISEPTSRTCRGFPPEGFLEKKEIPSDPWDKEFNYARPGTHNAHSYDLWSNGPDGEEGTSDDVTNWKSEG